MTQLLYLIAQSRRLFELEIARQLHHFGFEFLDALERLFGCERRCIILRTVALPLLNRARTLHHVADRLDDAAGCNTVLGIELDLLVAAPGGLRDGALSCT